MASILDDHGLSSSMQYNLIRMIGSGAYGEVFLVERKGDKKQLVIKKVDIPFVEGQDRSVFELAKQEADLITKLRHPNIVNMFSSFQEGNDLNLVMEFCQGGDLQKAIDEREEGDYFQETDIARWTLQLAVSLKYLHDKHILHRDITTQNVFLMANKRSVKLGDFGIAKIIEDTGGVGRTQIGNPSFAAPEFSKGQPYTLKSESWSLGVLLYNIAALKAPFHFDGRNLFSLFRAITQSTPKPLPDHFSNDLKDIVSKLMEKNPESRIKVSEAILTPFLLPTIAEITTQSELTQLKSTIGIKNNSERDRPTVAGPIYDSRYLFEAVLAGHLDAVKYYIEAKHVDLELKEHRFQRTALHCASMNGHLGMVKWLVKAGADVEAKSNNSDFNNTPIHLAAHFGQLGVTKFFIEDIDEAMIYWRNADGDIPMLIAAQGGQLDIVEYFILEKGVNIDVADGQLGRTALHYASQEGHLELVKWLVHHGANVKAKSNDSDINSMPIHYAAEFGQLEVVKFFIEEIDEAMLNWKDQENPMFISALNGHLDLVKYFIADRKVNIETRDDRFGRTALHSASQEGHLDVVKWLVKHGASVTAKSNDNDYNDMPIHLAAFFGHLQVVEYFVSKFSYLKSMKDCSGRSPSDWAKLGKNSSCKDVIEFLDKGYTI